jgi:hypothetical protein
MPAAISCGQNTMAAMVGSARWQHRGHAALGGEPPATRVPDLTGQHA